MITRILENLWHITVISISVAFSLLILNSCSGLIAPDMEGGGSQFSGNICSGFGLIDETTDETESAVQDALDAASDCQIDPSGGETTDLESNEGSSLGSVENEETDLGFVGVSVYATHQSTGLNVIIADSEVLDTTFKKIREYECRDCSNGDCETSSAVDTESTTRLLYLTFTHLPIDGTVADENGWPIEEDNTNKDEDDAYVANGLGFTDPESPTSQFTGTANFAEGTIPQAVGDAFELAIDFTSDTGSYKADLKGKVVEYPENPEQPECDAGQYPHAIYEDE